MLVGDAHGRIGFQNAVTKTNFSSVRSLVIEFEGLLDFACLVNRLDKRRPVFLVLEGQVLPFELLVPCL